MGRGRILLYVVARIMTALLAGLGLAFDITGAGLLTSSNNWGIIGLIAFAVFVVITVFREIGLDLQQKPNISVEPGIESSQAVLIVTNKGISKADFSAKARLKSFTSPPHLDNTDRLFQLAWESTDEVDCPIKGGGDKAKLLVMSKKATTLYDSGDLGKLSKELQKAGFKTEATYSYEGTLILNHLLNKKRYGTHLKGYGNSNIDKTESPDYACEIEISIFANPALRKPFRRIYQLHLNGHGMSFTEKLNSGKEGSQS